MVHRELNYIMKTNTVITPAEIRAKGIELAKLAYAHFEAEHRAIGEVKTYAIKHDVSSYEFQDWLTEAGYPLATARAYASEIRSVKANKEVKAKVKKEEISFSQGVKQAKEDRREERHGWDIMLIALSKFVQLAIKFQYDLDWMKLTLEKEYAKQETKGK
jgi:hypothetical protein